MPESRSPWSTSSDDDSTSMFPSLVNQLMDDGYAQAAARREEHGEARRTVGRVFGFVAAAVALGLLLTVAALQAQQAEPALEQEKADLITRIESQTEHLDALGARAEQLQEEVSELQSRVLASTGQGQTLAEEVSGLQVVTGTGRTVGPGLRITVDDAPPELVDPTDPTGGRVLDIDLQHLVNGLWWAGAEAISVNGQRMTTLTAIRGADRAITVDYRPLVRPYVVEAIGDPETLEEQFMASTGGSWFISLKQQGFRFEVARAEELRLSADASRQLRYASSEPTP